MATYEDPTDLKRQERDAEAEEAGARERRRKELDDLRWWLGHPQGRRIAMRLLDEAGVYRSSFNHSGSVMAFNEGKRHIGLFLTAEFLEASPDGFMKVLKEYGKTKDE
ncbi:MAG: endopeptidase [Limnohabitans sp.]